MEKSSEIFNSVTTEDETVVPTAGVSFERDERTLIEEVARNTVKTPEEVIENNRLTALRAGVIAHQQFSEDERVSLLTRHLREVQTRHKS